MAINAGILTIGNEVVDGQITNRNASWLATQLVESGFEVSQHISVNDDLKEINQALHFMEAHCQIILVTGGLGPTKDDLTRNALTQWAGQTLEFSESFWQNIQKKLSAREVTLRPGHRTQAEFPANATPIDNPRGVAPAFYFRKGQNFVAALPGPPHELHAIWEESLESILQNELEPKKNKRLYTWICMGAPESEIAHVVEECIDDKNLEYGFRLHKPYVEVKIWAEHHLNESQRSLFHQISEKLESWHMGTSIENIRQRFYDRLKNYTQIYVVDHLSQGLFLDRLKEYKLPENMRYQTYFEKRGDRKLFNKETCTDIIKGLIVGDHNLCLGLFPIEENKALAIINKAVIEIALPRKIPVFSQLGQLYAIETLFTKGYRELRE